MRGAQAVTTAQTRVEIVQLDVGGARMFGDIEFVANNIANGMMMEVISRSIPYDPSDDITTCHGDEFVVCWSLCFA